MDVTRDVTLDPRVQGVKIAALEKAIHQLVEAQQSNHEQIRKAFSLTDAHLWVLRLLCQDIVSGTVLKIDGPEPAVNLEAYYNRFNEWQKQQFAAVQSAQAAQQHGAGAGSMAEDYDVFGGDLKDENQERSEAVDQEQGGGEIISTPRAPADPLPRMSEAGGAPAGS